MKIKFENVGMIKNGEIKLDGLTVLAGENDTGKSTVGKLIFSIIRALNKYEEEFEEDRHSILINKVMSIYSELRKNINFESNSQVKEQFEPVKFLSPIFQSQKENKLYVLDFLEAKKSFLATLKIADEIKKKIIYQLDEIITTVNVDSKHIVVKQGILNKTFNSEFASQITNVYTQTESVIDGIEGDNSIFHISIKDNKVNELKYIDQLFFNDVTYIESPLMVEVNIAFASTEPLAPFRKSVALPLHTNDLLSKFRNALIISDLRGENDVDINSYIRAIIGGHFVYKKDKQSFVFEKSNEENFFEIKLSNVASGIKSFGLIQMLLNSGILTSRNLLIIDEPEVNLHPDWQIKYAELLVLLVREKKMNILLASHSPYFIEAIKAFSDKYNLGQNTCFYLSEKGNDNSSIITDVTDNLDKIFDKLSQPLKFLEEIEEMPESYDKKD